MQITDLIKTLCDGDHHNFRSIVYVDKIDKWYKQDFENKKAEYFKKYAKECELANKRMGGNQNKYGK